MSKHSFQTAAALACFKSCLLVFNFAFTLSGVAILSGGVWMEVELDTYMELSTEFSDTASFVLVGIGALIIMMGSLACCCTVKGQPVLLNLYGGFLAIIFVLEVGAGVSTFAYRTKLAEGFDKGLTMSIQNYQNVSYSRGRFDIDAMQSTLHCCGNHYYQDWLNVRPSMQVPKSCCRVIDSNCNTSNLNHIYTDGCYDIVLQFLESNIGLVAGVASGIALFPLVGVILSCCLSRLAHKTKYEPVV